mmetsp:Transcript_4247/g.17961  ORF Transcript_4247/g.17961 Transcript_4247/m.17961 type:complete len:356 (+) Transcript_4247:1189-2256(+)
MPWPAALEAAGWQTPPLPRPAVSPLLQPRGGPLPCPPESQTGRPEPSGRPQPCAVPPRASQLPGWPARPPQLRHQLQRSPLRHDGARRGAAPRPAASPMLARRPRLVQGRRPCALPLGLAVAAPPVPRKMTRSRLSRVLRSRAAACEAAAGLRRRLPWRCGVARRGQLQPVATSPSPLRAPSKVAPCGQPQPQPQPCVSLPRPDWFPRGEQPPWLRQTPTLPRLAACATRREVARIQPLQPACRFPLQPGGRLILPSPPLRRVPQRPASLEAQLLHGVCWPLPRLLPPPRPQMRLPTTASRTAPAVGCQESRKQWRARCRWQLRGLASPRRSLPRRAGHARQPASPETPWPAGHA